jgi:cardiolipin synthase A/B
MQSSSWFYIAVVGYGITLVTIPFILMAQKRPAGTLAWLWAVILFPYLAPLAYLVFGSEQIYRKRLLRRHRKQRQSKTQEAVLLFPSLKRNDANLSQELTTLNLYPASSYHEAVLLLDAQEFYPALEKAINEALTSVHFEVFIWRDDAYGKRFLACLIAAAKRGVKVRLMLDELGCISIFQNTFADLRAAGGEFTWFNGLHPLHNRWAFSLRNHRKLQIIDGKIAFVGGMNIGREYMGEDPAVGSWRDVQIRLTGAVVTTLAETFRNDWFFATDRSLPAEKEAVESGEAPAADPFPAHVIEEGPDSPTYPLVLSILTMLHRAQKRIWFTAGYFFPQEPLLSALKLCAARGVEVRILVGVKNDHRYIVLGARYYYEELLKYGVKIFEYAEGMHHAKIILLDDAWVSVGSANLDVRSMRLNFELNVALYSPKAVKQLQPYMEKDFACSEEIIYRTFVARSSGQRVLENLCRLIGPLA